MLDVIKRFCINYSLPEEDGAARICKQELEKFFSSSVSRANLSRIRAGLARVPSDTSDNMSFLLDKE